MGSKTIAEYEKTGDDLLNKKCYAYAEAAFETALNIRAQAVGYCDNETRFRLMTKLATTHAMLKNYAAAKDMFTDAKEIPGIPPARVAFVCGAALGLLGEVVEPSKHTYTPSESEMALLEHLRTAKQ